MSYKSILLASAAVAMFVGTAKAEDITSPFYLPNQGGILSNTSVEYDRTKLKHNEGVSENLKATEEVTYGVTDNFAVVGTLGNYFDFKGFTNQEFNNDHNFDYSVGAKYNHNQGNWMSQIGASYYTFNPESWYGHKGTDSRWYKELNAEAKLGYSMMNGLIPYGKLSLSSPIDQSDREIDYSTFMGVHKEFSKFSLDGGLRYDFTLDGTNTNTWWAQGEANYFVKQNMTVGVFGEYYLGGNYSDTVDYGYTIGLNAKVLF